MPLTKNALQRYKVLDECFSDQYREYSFKDLMDRIADELFEKCGVDKGISTRQLRTDISMMTKNGAPIYVKDRAKKDENGKFVPIYYYGDINTGERVSYRYFGTKMVQEVRDTIGKMVELRKLYQDLPVFSWIQDIITPLDIEFDERRRQHFVSFERNPDLKGMNWLSQLIKHTMKREPLRITYQPFFGVKKKIYFHPYHLKQFNNRWYLWGLDEERDIILNLALDRIDNFVELEGHPFKKNVKVDFSTYFDDVIGVTVPQAPIEKIILKFSAMRFPYVINKPIHRSQMVHPDIPNAIILRLKHNRELEARILNYGPDVEVLAPESLRKSISEKVNSMMRLYFSRPESEKN